MTGAVGTASFGDLLSPSQSIQVVKTQEVLPGGGVVHPYEGDTCVVSLRARSGPLVDVEPSPSLDHAEVVIGWRCGEALYAALDACLMSMKAGEYSVFDVTLDSAERCPNPSLLEVHLHSLKSSTPAYARPGSEKLRCAGHFKERGNAFVAADQLPQAVECYAKALRYIFLADLRVDKDTDPEVEEVLVAVYLNLAACQLKADNLTDALANCDRALQLRPSNVKALYRRARCLFGLGEVDKAHKDLVQALKLDPSNKAVKTLLNSVKEKIKDCDEKLAMGLKKLF